MVGLLLKHVEAHQGEFGDSGVGRYDSHVDKSRRVSSILPAAADFRAAIVGRTERVLPRIFVDLGCAPFLPARFEVEIAAHGDGAFFAKHADTFVEEQSPATRRVISMVYYFHAVPKAFSGGHLRLHSLGVSGREGTFVDIEPLRDTAVFFPAWFQHEVLPVACAGGRFMESRFAINCWIHQSAVTTHT